MIAAIITVLAWGLWLVPSEGVKLKCQQTRTFYVTLAVLGLAILVAAGRGFEPLGAAQFWPPFAGGMLWALSAFFAFVGVSRLGMTAAFGIWAPLNILVSMAWGMILFGEFLSTGLRALILAVGAVAIMIVGIIMIIFASASGTNGTDIGRHRILGYLGALGAGIGLGSYFIPIRLSHLSVWTAMLPMALGMFGGGCLLAAFSHSSLKLEKSTDYGRVLATGLLWGIGNYGALFMMSQIGTGKGFTIAQLCVVVNALAGIFWFKNPKPGTKAARRILVGVILATGAGAILGHLKS